MVRRPSAILLVMALLGACRTETADPPPAPVPKTAECAPTHQAIGVACVPRVDLCGAGEVPTLGGGCRAVGVPPDGCAPGFVHDGKGACAPVLPEAPCAPGSFARPGEASCAPIDACGTERYPKVDGTALHVDAAYLGDSDGTASKPFRALGEALARTDATTIAIAAGSYAGDLVLDRPVRLIGVCAAKVEIVGATSGAEAASVVVRAKASLEHLSVRGPAHGVVVDGAGARLASIHVHDTGGAGVWARRDANDLLVVDSLVERSTDYGVVVTGAVATVEASVVRATRFTSVGVGIQANPSGTSASPTGLRVVRSVVEQTVGSGVRASGAPVTLEGSVVRDTRPRPDGTWGVGAIADVHGPSKRSGQLSLERSLVQASRYFGVVASSASVLLDRSVVRDTRVEEKSGKLGRGVAAQAPSSVPTELVIRDSAVVGNMETGVDAVGGATVAIERSVVSDTRAIGASGSGVAAMRYDKTGLAPTLSIVDSAIERNEVAGVLAYGGVQLRGARIAHNRAFGLVLRGAAARVSASLVVGPDGASSAHGIFAEPDGDRPPELSLEDVVIEATRVSGLALVGGTLDARRVHIRDVAPRGDGSAGVGLAVSRRPTTAEPSATLADIVVERAHGAGMSFVAARAELARCVVRETRALESGFGDGIVASGLVYGPSVTRTSTVSLRDGLLERNARAGVAVFGGTFDVSATWLTCNAIDLNVEHVAAIGPDGPLPATARVGDLGGNHCGCGDPSACRAQTTGLQPIGPTGE